MRVMSKNQTKLVQKLTQLAHGDTKLVNEAIREVGNPNEPARLSDVVNYIKQKRGSSRKKHEFVRCSSMYKKPVSEHQ